MTLRIYYSRSLQCSFDFCTVKKSLKKKKKKVIKEIFIIHNRNTKMELQRYRNNNITQESLACQPWFMYNIILYYILCTLYKKIVFALFLFSFYKNIL